MKEQILEMLEEIRPGEEFCKSSAFIDDELLDSFEIISLVSMLEEKYGIEIDGLDIVANNFQNIESIISLIKNSKKV